MNGLINVFPYTLRIQHELRLFVADINFRGEIPCQRQDGFLGEKNSIQKFVNLVFARERGSKNSILNDLKT